LILNKIRKKCPLCNYANIKNKIFLKKNINKLNIESFSSRKIPEFYNFKFVVCKNCSLVYSVEFINAKQLKKFYEQSVYKSLEDEIDAANSYFKKIKKIIKFPNKNILDIGCGAGSFLNILKDNKCKNLIGIEPSIRAIKLADKRIKRKIINNFFENTKLPKNYFNYIFSFMTLEHLINPKRFLLRAYKLLKKDSYMIICTHNVNGIINRVLNKKSPIIDIEHYNLFSKKTLNLMLKNTGFKNIKNYTLINKYSIIYLINLLYIPKFIKKSIITLINKTILSKIKIFAPLGNFITVAQK
jgi:2-polyprenyl-3-methyl-5-hydroxy-6-metoxy-1,4-benzoquinol methylase